MGVASSQEMPAGGYNAVMPLDAPSFVTSSGEGKIRKPVLAWCQLCRQRVPEADLERHMVACLFPKGYNVTILERSLESECPICLEEFERGQALARLPCMCTYHKWCLSSWWVRQQCCPLHTDLPATDD